eukprot:Sdes_comp20380_c0_seq2m14254
MNPSWKTKSPHKQEETLIGPARQTSPSQKFPQPSSNLLQAEDSRKRKSSGSPKSSESSSDDEDDCIGPKISEFTFLQGQPSQYNVERFEAVMKNRELNASSQKTLKREEWMTEMPDKFKKKTKTTTLLGFPAHSAQEESKEGVCSSSEKKSLLSLHQEKLKHSNNVAEGKEAAKKERIPFDREKDMTVRVTCSKKKQEMINQAQNFHSRFSKEST